MNPKRDWGTMDEKHLVIGAMIILGFAVSLLVVLPYMLLSSVPPPAGLKPYTEAELRGRASYVRNGCVYCHSQQPRDPAQAPDVERGWGRPSVAGDYHYDKPHLLGTMRTGPDLFNIAARQPSRDWHLGHLYQPRAYAAGSIMPAFPFLFAVRKGAAGADEVVVSLPPQYANSTDVIVAKPEALDLVAYLLALDHTYPALGGSRSVP